MTPVGWQGLLKSQPVPQWMPLPQGTCPEGPQFSVAAPHSPSVLPSSLSPSRCRGSCLRVPISCKHQAWLFLLTSRPATF